MSWRVWFAFEAKPGVPVSNSKNRTHLWGALAESCRGSNGKIDPVEYDCWLQCFIDHEHLWGDA